MAIVRFLRTLVGSTAGALGFLSGVSILAIGILTTYSVFMRYLLGKPDIWTYPVSSYLFCFAIFSSIADAQRNGAHVRVDYIFALLPALAARVLNLIARALSVLFISVLFYQTWVVFAQSYRRGRVDETALSIPLSMVQWILPLGAGLLLLLYVLQWLSSGEEEQDS